MTETVTAVYENGVFRPTTPLSMPDGMTVRLTVVPGDGSPPWIPGPTDLAEARRLMWEIANLPEEPTGDPTVTGRDHDRILYGSPGGAR